MFKILSYDFKLRSMEKIEFANLIKIGDNKKVEVKKGLLLVYIDNKTYQRKSSLTASKLLGLNEGDTKTFIEWCKELTPKSNTV